MTPLDRVFYVQGREPEFSMKDFEKIIRDTKTFNDAARDTQKKYFDRTRREIDLKVGKLVLKVTHAISLTRTNTVGKFCPKFEGRFRIGRIHNDVFTIEADGQELVTKVDRLKRYYAREEMALFRMDAVVEAVDRQPVVEETGQAM